MEPWSSGVRAEVSAATYVEGDSVTVTLFNDASTTRYASRCWTVLRFETGNWRARLSASEILACTPVLTIAAGGSIQARVALWPDGVEPLGPGTYSIWYEISPNAADFATKSNFAKTPEFEVTAAATARAELR